MHVRRALLTGLTMGLMGALSAGWPAGAAGDDQDDSRLPLAWRELAAVPDALGVAAPFAGVDQNILLVGGGANFPERPPWEGGAKVWHDRVWALEQPEGAWREVGRLPRPLGYGVSFTTAEGVICVGGSDAQQHFADVFRLSLRDGKLHTETLPPLPQPVANACGAMLGKTLYVAGGLTSPQATSTLKTFYALDLSAAKPQWEALEPWPGPPRMLAVAAAQDGAFFLLSGTDLAAGPEGQPVRRYLTDGYRFQPGRGWRPVAESPHPLVAAPSPAPAVGPAHVLVMSGDDGSKVNFQPLAQHPGFPSTVLAYHTLANTWTAVGETPAPRVTSPVVNWNNAWVVISGEQRPGVRSPQVWSLQVGSRKANFGWWNYGALTLYPLIMLGVAWRVGRKGTSDEFFRSGQRIPWWAAGLSIYATMLSSITFMAIPAKSYVTDWSFVLANLSVPLLAPLIIAVYLPFYRQLNVTSAYEYLERRFNLAARWFASASFIVLQVGRTAIVLYLPALALATVSNFDMRTCIAIMGVICILMTFEGGLESVVWTDVAQTVILLLGALVTLFVAWGSIPGGAGEMWRIAQADDKFWSGMRWDADLTVATGWVILLGNLFITLGSYTAGQDVVQRYISTKDRRAAARSIWTNALMVIPSTLLFFAVGTSLYVFYKLNPERLDPTLKNDAIFPQFIVNELPFGLGGLVVAGIFAAAQPTSSLNSIATAWVTDFHARLRPGMSDAARVRVAKRVTIGSGVLGTAVALLMTTFDIASAWDAFLGMVGLTGSTLAGLFALGIFSRRAHGRGAIVGAVASVAVLIYVQRATSLHFFTYGAIGLLTCCGVGWLASGILPAPPRDLTGLTLHTLTRPECSATEPTMASQR